MRWQQKARLAIATFVIVFAGVVLFVMRQRSTIVTPPLSDVPADDGAVVRSSGAIDLNISDKGRLQVRIQGKDHKTYKDGRTEISSAVITVPDRGNGTVTIKADKADLLTEASPGQLPKLKRGTFTGNVRLTNDKGVVVTGDEAMYEESTGIATIPGPVQFSRGRTSGTGVGATYDKNRDVLQILDKADVTVAPDPATGDPGAHASAGSIEMARAENYITLTKNAQIVAQSRTATGDEITARLNEAGEVIRQLEIRGSSRITSSGAEAQNMSARDIDLTYAPDGRTLQGARLVENAVVDLPGAEGAPGRRISGRTVDLAMGPDGTTLTGLNASENVQVDLPPSADLPAKRIRARSLAASGPAGAGLQQATFTGAVEYTETRPARGSVAAIDRTAHANRLIITTKPGFGEVERADFLGNFTMDDAGQGGSGTRETDGNSPGSTGRVSAGAPRALYYVNRDLVELSPQTGEPGPTPFLHDERMRVSARNIRFSPSTRKLSAEADVQSTMQPRRQNDATTSKSGEASGGGRMPALLKEDKPVTVVANQLEYDGSAQATYTGKARLWQDQSKIDAETIILDDRTGNLTARTDVRTTMPLEDTDPVTKQRTITETNAEADTLVYDDNKRLATYTGTAEKQARMRGVHGDVTADRIEVYLDQSGDRLERAIATGNVVVREALRTASGQRLVFTAADDTYVMTGTPVMAYERETPTTCKVTEASTLTFKRVVGSIRAETTGLLVVKTTTLPSPCPSERRD